jgi:hypothetical protein
MIYTAPYVMLLMWETPLRGQAGGGWALEVETFFEPCEMASSRQASVIWGLKKSRFPGPNPLPLAQVMDSPALKALHTRPYQSEVVLCSAFTILHSVVNVL